MKNRHLFIFLCWLLLPPGVIAANAEEQSEAGSVYAVRGKVLEKGSRLPLEGVQVVNTSSPDSAVSTNADGEFLLRMEQTGDFEIILFKLNYLKPEPLKISITDNKPEHDIKLYLEPATVLPGILVEADRNPDRVGKIAISGEELEQVAGSGGDPLRGLQALPGITVTHDGSASPAIRGSAPGDNRYYVDFLPVDYLFHFGGAVSVINADLVDDFNLYAAAYGAEFGDVLGAVIDVNLREPRNDRLGGKLNINLYESDFLVEGPVSDTQSFYFGARRSYYDLLLPASGTLDDDSGVEYRQFPVFTDYQGKYRWQPDRDHTVTLQLLGAQDKFEFYIPEGSEAVEDDPDLAGEALLENQYDSQGVVWQTNYSKTARNRFAVGHTRSSTRQRAGAAGYGTAIFDDYYLKDAFSFDMNDNHQVLLGGGITRTVVEFDLDYKDPRCTEFDPLCDFTSAQRVQSANTLRVNFWDLYAKDRWRLADDFIAILGVRATGEEYLDENFIEPRIGAEWELSDALLATAGWGLYHQFPEGTQVVDELGNPELSQLRGEHSVLGIGSNKKADWTWKLEGYYKEFDKLVIADDITRYSNSGEGRAYGVDLLLKKERVEKLSGWLAFTWSRSERTNKVTGETFPARVDQPIVAKLVANYRFNTRWSFGAKWIYHSGSPYTPIVGSVPRPGSTTEFLPVYGDINSERLPSYHRLDLRLDRDFLFNTWKLNTYFELLNAYNRKNVAGYSYNNDYSERETVYQLPILISFGIQAEF